MMKESLPIKKLEDELRRVDELNRTVGKDFMISGEYKDDREWVVLTISDSRTIGRSHVEATGSSSGGQQGSV